MAEDCVIGIDVGTTAIKAVLIDSSGERLAQFSRPVAMDRPAPGLAEQHPNAWSEGVTAALAAFAEAHELEGLAGIGICSQVNTHVFVDADGDALLPAMTWQDTRCTPDAAALEGQVSAEQKTAWLGSPMPIDASHALSRIAHVRRVHPGVFSRTRHVLLPKDYCVMRLTGAVGSDPVSAVGLVGRDGYAADLLDLVPGAASLLPPLSSFHHVAGRVSEGLPCAGVPVVTGTMDAWAGMFGIGVVNDGDAMYQSGTSEILGIVSSTIHPTSGVITFPAYEGIVMHAAPTQSGGAALAWLAGVLGRTPAELSALAEATVPSDAVPHFLPHLQGERAPLWDPGSRGVFARIDARAAAPEMVRSVMEGVAFSARLAFNALQSSARVRVTAANLGGGGARSDVWCQIRADVLGFPLRRTAIGDSAALGAAILAGLGGGLMGSLHEAVRHLVKFDRSFAPNPVHRGYYDEKFGHYTALYETLRSFNDRF
ncbi:MAG TPA: FGGY family carbohydrate kinase [Devosiaceae bacterium]|jgi:xylulokinase|nr:FGGY family carbohydrate kinase [Devosiaceae bacterium]